ncbi:GNAT family N-acetyltransferase [Streptomyces sp. NA04227]|uniref:GNAT family N-acetyltransferase n=1 Tax=Streptomyces sp. NA04227 TaxID=2742136 RepID=UPI001591B258|nr:GNAT family protein [Streptomyces sp. NA04227]QKW08223.1 GNAT family N-acetyltransferase [Streptomyces sp. NA04227]
MHPVNRASSRLLLRELTTDDVDAVFAVYGSPEATEHLSFEPRSVSEVRDIVSRSIASSRAVPRSEYALAVVRRDADEIIGADEVIGFGRLATDPHQPSGATMGFALRPEVWRAGYGLETVRLLLGLAFDDLGLHRVWGARSPANVASAVTMNRAGMVEEGRIREHVQKGGVWRDSVVHSILEREWAAR